MLLFLGGVLFGIALVWILLLTGDATITRPPHGTAQYRRRPIRWVDKQGWPVPARDRCPVFGARHYTTAREDNDRLYCDCGWSKEI